MPFGKNVHTPQVTGTSTKQGNVFLSGSNHLFQARDMRYHDFSPRWNAANSKIESISPANLILQRFGWHYKMKLQLLSHTKRSHKPSQMPALVCAAKALLGFLSILSDFGCFGLFPAIKYHITANRSRAEKVKVT